MNMLISISCYLMAVFLAVQLANRRYIRLNRLNSELNFSEEDDIELNGDAEVKPRLKEPISSSYKISILSIIVIALLFTIYNFIITKLSVSLSGDRYNYNLNYLGLRNSSSSGLTFLISILRYFSSNVETLYYVSTFVTVTVTLIAYKICDEASPKALLFLFTTQYVFFTFAGMKQCYTNAFASLCIILALRNKGIKDNLLCIALIALSIWFHPSGYLLIILFIMIKVRKTRAINIIFFITMTIAIVFLEPLLLRSASLVAPIAPSAAIKVYEYFGESGKEALKTTGFMSALKGIPFYIITLVGWLKRRELLKEINNYDNYLFLSGVISFIYISSVYNSWVIRLAYFLYLPVAIYFVKIMQSLKNKNNYIILNFLVFGINALITLRFVVLIYLNYGGF